MRRRIAYGVNILISRVKDGSVDEGNDESDGPGIVDVFRRHSRQCRWTILTVAALVVYTMIRVVVIRENPLTSSTLDWMRTRSEKHIRYKLIETETKRDQKKRERREKRRKKRDMARVKLVDVNISTTKQARPQNLTVGIIANEFFDPTIGRIGGFGMATKMVGTFFTSRSDLNVKIVFVYASPEQGSDQFNGRIHYEILSWPLISMIRDIDVYDNNNNNNNKSVSDGGDDVRSYATTALQQANIDVFLTIDFRKSYERVFSSLPKVPVVLWARDPRTKKQVANLAAIRHPSYPDKQPPGVSAPEATRAQKTFYRLEDLDESSDTNLVLPDPRRFLIGVVWMPALKDRLLEAYNINPHGNAMPLSNIVKGCDNPRIVKNRKPAVIFVGRLDPYKRPWLLIELAYFFPDVEFWVLGLGHFNSYKKQKDRGREIPSNVKFVGIETGDSKWALLSSAWFLISTSAHEGIAISYLEALSCETPVLSTVDPGGFVSSFGIFAGEANGSGMEALPALRNGFHKLLSNNTFREEKGRAGREHVSSVHNEETFLDGFMAILGRMDFARNAVGTWIKGGIAANNVTQLST